MPPSYQGAENVVAEVTMAKHPIHAIRFAGGLLLQLLCVSALLGQADRATVAGHITDPTGAVLPGVNVVAKDIASGSVFTGVTNNAGAYSIGAFPSATTAFG